MSKIRKVVIPVAGPRIALAFALPTAVLTMLTHKRGRRVRSAAHAAALTGRAVFLGVAKKEVHNA